ncbi:hypothetical protein ACFQ0M_47115 [Kitasatospora aburaviensis]
MPTDRRRVTPARTAGGGPRRLPWRPPPTPSASRSGTRSWTAGPRPGSTGPPPRPGTTWSSRSSSPRRAPWTATTWSPSATSCARSSCCAPWHRDWRRTTCRSSTSSTATGGRRARRRSTTPRTWRHPAGSPPRTGEFFRRHAALVRALVLDGYAVRSHPTPAGHLEEVVVGRFLRRLPVLRRALPGDVTTAERITVNGVRCTAPHLVLERLTGRLAPLAPARLMTPAHGDANTRNVLWCARSGATEEFRLIDPRGSVEPWDPVYDLAKTLFSLTVWDPALRTGFSVRRSKHGYEVGFRQPVFPGYRAAIHRFLPHLASHGGLSLLFRDDPGWLDRLLLTHDLHVLAEAPCRLSDRKAKPDLQGRDSTPEALALGHYLLGTLLINDLVDRLDRTGHVDAAGHLALVTDHLPGGP